MPRTPVKIVIDTTKQVVASNHDNVQYVLNRLRDAKQIVYDAETSGLDWRVNHIVGHVITFSGDPRDSYYLPVRHALGGNVGPKGPQTRDGWDGKVHPLEKELVPLLNNSDITVVGHHLNFDNKFLSRVGFKLQCKFIDTIINEPLLDEYAKYSLEACANRHQVQAKKSSEIKTYLMQCFPDIKNERDAMGHFWRLSGDDIRVVEYACGDGTTTWQLNDAQLTKLTAQGLDLVHNIESRLIPVLSRMQIRGVKVDEGRLEWLSDPKAKGSVAWHTTKLRNDFPSGFNALSKVDVQAWLEKHGVTDWPRTAPTRNFPDGQASFTASWLEGFEAGRQIIDLRKLENLESSFITPLREQHLWHGRVHTTFNQLRNDDFGTVTGRLSSNAPNMQQVPKHDEELGRLFRSAFVPDYGLWGERDYSQIEPRLMAYYTRAKVFLDDYRNNPDADSHTAIAKQMRPDWEQMTKAEQKSFRNATAKRCNQTVITGGGKNALMNKYKMTQQEAETMLARYFKTVPELKPFQKRAARRFRERGYVMDVLGRRAHLIDPDKDYTATNRLLQMSNASVLKLKMVEAQELLDKRKAPVEMLLNCHDALSFQFDEDARPVYDEVKALMEDFSSEDAVIKLDLPIKVDEGEGRSWAEATYGEEK